MDDIAEGVLAFIRWTDKHPLPPHAPTRDVLSALRRRLDVDAPGWRERAFKDDPDVEALEVEVHLGSGRVVRGALARRPGRARGEAA